MFSGPYWLLSSHMFGGEENWHCESVMLLGEAIYLCATCMEWHGLSKDVINDFLLKKEDIYIHGHTQPYLLYLNRRSSIIFYFMKALTNVFLSRYQHVPAQAACMEKKNRP